MPKPRANTELPIDAASRSSPPERAQSGGNLSPATRRRVEERLVSLAERFGALDASLSSENLEPTSVMKRLREQLTFRQNYLNDEQLAELVKSSDDVNWQFRLAAPSICINSSRARSTKLPPDFANGPLTWQLRVLAYLVLPPRRGRIGVRQAEELPGFLAESLAFPFVGAVERGLDDLDPVIVDYARFLRRLPKR